MDETRERLAEEMAQRRKKLRLRWTQVARRADMSVQTLLRIRTGETAVTDFAAEGIEQALEWPTGHIAGILGTEARPKPEPVPTDPAFALLRQAHAVYVELYGLDNADRLIEEHIRLINAARDRAKSRTSDQPGIG